MLEDSGDQVLVDDAELVRHVTDPSDPPEQTLRTEAAAALLRDLEGDPTQHLTQAAPGQDHVTILVADSSLHSNYLVEGRVSEVVDGELAIWPKGLRSRGFWFPLEYVQVCRDGYGQGDQIRRDLAQAGVPALAADHDLDSLPEYVPAVHDADEAPVQAAFLMRHRESADKPFVAGCVLLAVSSDSSHVYGYLWTPKGQGPSSRFVRTTKKRVESMSARVAISSPIPITVGECPNLPGTRSELYAQLTTQLAA